MTGTVSSEYTSSSEEWNKSLPYREDADELLHVGDRENAMPVEGSINHIPIVKRLAQKVGALHSCYGPLSVRAGPVLETMFLVLIETKPSITS